MPLIGTRRAAWSFMLLALATAWGSPASAQFRAEDVSIHALTDDYSWGFWAGVKQPLGSFKNGLSIHQYSKSNYPKELVKGNPDYILWVDEINGTSGISERPTGEFDGNTENPGGMATFDEDGTIWYTFGGRAVNLPLDLFRSNAPYDVTSFTKVLDDYETYAASTAPTVHARDGKVMLCWRHGWSSGVDTTVRFRRYDIAKGFDSWEAQKEIGKGVETEEQGSIGIEQLYTRYDPRSEQLFLTWQWFDAPWPMGSNPFVRSDDFGATWRRTDGTAYADLPLDYSEIDAVITPFDHISRREHTEWVVADIGVSPTGTFWMTTPRGNATNDNWRLGFWFFRNGVWEQRQLTTGMLGQSKPHAVGATDDYLVFVYSELAERNVLKARITADSGDTWSDPVVLDVIDPDDAISWVSFVQPADGYPDNTARFFYAHYEFDRGVPAKRYLNNVRWIGFRVQDGPIPGDIDGDGVVDLTDMLQLLSVWGECPDCPEDLDGDGMVGLTDLILLLSNWTDPP